MTAKKSILVALQIALIRPVVISSVHNVRSTQQPTHISAFGKISSIAVMISALFQGIYGVAVSVILQITRSILPRDAQFVATIFVICVKSISIQAPMGRTRTVSLPCSQRRLEPQN